MANLAHQILWGEYGPSDTNNYVPWQTRETQVGRDFDIYHKFASFDSTFSGHTEWLSAVNDGHRLVITWQPSTTSGLDWSAILAGTWDSYIQTQINYLKNNYPADADIVIRLAHEMNGNWYPWNPGYTNGTVRCTSTQQYVDTWKHIVDVVRALDVPNIRFWWCPNVMDTGKTIVRTTGTGQSGLYTFTVASATGIQVGDVAYETDSLGNGISEAANRIGPDARVQQINGTTITVDVPNDGSFTNAYVAFARLTYPMEAFYPSGNDSQGRPYVDITGYDSYNSLVGTFKTALDTVKGVTYVTHPVQASAYDRVTALASTPEVWIGEFGCEDYNDPATTSHPPVGCKATFYTDLFAIDKYASGLSRLGAIVFYDRVGNIYLDGSALPIAYGNIDLGSRQWHHDTSPGAWAAFVNPTTGFLQTTPPSTLVPNGDFEAGVGNWYDSCPFFGGTAATLTTSTTVKHGGTQALQVTYANSSVAPLPGEWISGLVEGRHYTLSGWVRVPAGSPPVKMDGLFLPGAQSAFSTTTDVWERLTVSFVYSTPSGAAPGDLWVGANPASDTVASSVAGQGFYLDDVAIFPGALITDSAGVTDAGQQIIATPSEGGTTYQRTVSDAFLGVVDGVTHHSLLAATATLAAGTASASTASGANFQTTTASLVAGAAVAATAGMAHRPSATNSAGVTDAGQQIIATPASGGTVYERTLADSFLSDRASVGHGLTASLAAGVASSATGTISATGNAWTRTVDDLVGGPSTDAVARGPGRTVTDSAGVGDDGGTPVLTPTGGNVTREVIDDVGLTEPDFTDVAYRETQTDDEGITHPEPPDRRLGSSNLKSETVTDALSFTDEATWTKYVANVIPVTVTDLVGLTDSATYTKGQTAAITITDSAGITHPTVDRIVGVATNWTRTVTDALSLTDSAYAYRPDQVGLHLEIKSVDPATGAVRGPLPDHSELTLSPIFCDVGSVKFKYLRNGINAQWVAVDEEFAVFLNDQEIGDLRFIVDELVDNDATEDEWMTVAGRTTLALLEQAVVYPGGWPTATDPPRHDFTSATPGFILKTLVDRAQARGSITEISTATFSASVDSNGTPWRTTQGQPLAVTVSFDAGTDYLKVVQALVDMGAIEVRMAGRELIVLNPGTLMVDRTAQTQPLVFRTGASVVDSPRKESTRDLRTALLVAGADNTYVEVKDDTAVAVFGRREGYENQGGINDAGTLTSYGQTKLTGTADVKFEKTHGLTFADATTPRPWFDFRLGDWVYSDYGTGTLERLRIRQWTIQQEESGILTGTVSLNDLFAEKIERLSRELNKIVSGATVVGGSEPPPEDGTGGDTLPPGVPQNLTFSSSTYADPSGLILAQITANWTAVTTNADGSAAADIDHYEVGLSYVGPVDFTTVGQSLSNVFYYSPVRPGAQVWIRVRAVDTSGNPGGWSAWVTGTIQSDGQPPPVPLAPVVEPYLGQLKITWNGQGTGGVTMPIDFKYAEVWISLIDGSALTDANWLAQATLLDTMSASGSTVATDLTYGVPVYVRLRSVDTSNNRSAFGPQGTGTPELIVSDDMSDIEKASITTTWLDDFNAYDTRWSKIAGVASQSIVDLTDGLTGGSALAVAGDGTYEWGQNIAFDPDVLYRVKARVRSTGGGTTGKQYIAAGTFGSFETETTGWGPFAGQTSTIVRSTDRAYNTTGWPTSAASALITWAANNDMIGATVSNLIIGHTYTFSAPVFVTTGSAAVRLAIFMNSTSAASTTTNAWQRLTLTFVATATSHWVAVQHVPPTSGSAIDLQASFESGVDGFYTTVVGSGGGGTADLTMDLASAGATPTGWTPYPFGTLPSATGTTTSVSVNWQTTKTYFHSGTGSVRVTGYSSGTSLDSTPFAVMRTTDPYSVTPGQTVTMGASFALVTASQYGGQCWMGIATSATSTPPAATQNVWDIGFANSNPAWQGWYLSPSIGGGSALQWVDSNNSARTFTIPTGHTYAWLWVAVQFGANDGYPQSYDYLVDDIVFSAATSVTPPTLASSTDRAFTTNAGTHSLKVTWNGTAQDASRDVSLSTGVAHCASAYVYVPAGSPAVTIKSLRTTSTGSVVTTTGQSTSTTGSWQRIYVTDTPQSGDTAQRIALISAGAGTAYVDAFQVEQGSTPTAWSGLAAPTLGQVYVDDAMVEDGPAATVFTTLMAGTGRLVTLGLMGVAADGTTRVSPTGTSAATITPIAASNRDPGDNVWTTYEGFVKGSAVAGSLDDTLSRDAATPGAMQSSTRYVRPAFAVNQVGGSGTTQVDMMTVEVLAFPSNVIQDFMVANMSAGKITAGAIRAVLIIADSQGKILAGDPLGARVEMNQHGLFAYTASGDQEFILDADTGSATFSGTLQGSTFRTALPPYPRIELSGDFAQRVDCYPDMNAWISPPGLRTGVTGSTTIEIFGGQNSSGTGGRITASFPAQPLYDPWTGAQSGTGSRITVTADQTEFTGPSTGGRVLVGNTYGQGWIDRPYSNYVRGAVALSSGLVHNVILPGSLDHTPYNNLEIRSTPIKDLYLIKGTFSIYGGGLGDGSTIGSLPTGFPAPARTQIVNAICNWTANRVWIEISTAGYLYLHGLSTTVYVNGYSVRVNGMYDTY